MNPEELKRIAVLQAMDDAALARLAAVLEDLNLADGQTVFAEGDPGDSMYFLMSGRVRVEKLTDAAGTSRKTLTVLEPGDYFGEMSLFDQKPRSASAVAEGSAHILRLSKTSFDALHGQGGQAGMSVLFAMIRTSSDRIRRLSSQLVVYDEIGKAIGESKSLQELLDVVLHQLRLATLADWGLLLLKPQYAAGLTVRTVEGLTLTPEQRDALAEGRGFLAPVLAEPRQVVAKNIEAEEPFKSCARLGFELPALLVTPILTEGQLLGLIALGDHEVGQFDLNAVNLARGVARQAGQAILNALHREEEQARSRHSRQFVRF
jgi:CRP/FNR family cyclic AMP-dependent transcriptional regulator